MWIVVLAPVLLRGGARRSRPPGGMRLPILRFSDERLDEMDLTAAGATYQLMPSCLKTRVLNRVAVPASPPARSDQSSVSVPVMDIGVMRVCVDEWLVPMRMAVRLFRWIIRCVCVLVMRIVDMQMLVFERLVDMFVLVVFGQVEQHADHHE
jgi:hypothetical protein